jgi:hypothetical protein
LGVSGFHEIHGLDTCKAHKTRSPKTFSEDDIAAAPVSMIEYLKVLANRRDVPYQSLLKVFLAERLAEERNPRPQ